MSGELHEVSVAIGKLTASVDGIQDSLKSGSAKFDELTRILNQVSNNMALMQREFASHRNEFTDHATQEGRLFAEHHARISVFENIKTRVLAAGAALMTVGTIIGSAVSSMFDLKHFFK